MDWILSSVWLNERISSQISHWCLKTSKLKIMDFVFERLSYFEVVVSVDNLVNRFVQIYMTWRQFWWNTKLAINISNIRFLCGESSMKGLYEILGNTDISFYPVSNNMDAIASLKISLLILSKTTQLCA